MFLLKHAERLERVEPAAICGQGEKGEWRHRDQSSRRDFASSRVFRGLCCKQVKVGPTYPHMNQTKTAFTFSF